MHFIDKPEDCHQIRAKFSHSQFVGIDVIGPFSNPGILSLADEDDCVLVDLKALGHTEEFDNALTKLFQSNSTMSFWHS